MAKRKPDRRPTSQNAPQQPRDRLAEIRAEIRDVQQQIEAKRRDTRLIRSAEDLKAWERSIGELTDRLAALLLAEAMQAALGDPENRRKARSLAQGAGHTLKDQGPRDVTLRTVCGQVVVRVPYFSRNCDRDKAGKAMYRSCCSGVCTTAVRRGSLPRSARWWRCWARWKRSSRSCAIVDNPWTSRPPGRSLIGSPRAPVPPSVQGV